MSVHDDEPELAGYIPSEGKPLRSPHLLRIMRVIVVVGLAGLVLPGILTTLNVGQATAAKACQLWVAYAYPDSPGSDARFEVFGPGGFQWECYTLGKFGGDVHVASLGFIPGTPVLPNQRPSNS